MHITGGRLNIPAVVTQTLRRKYSDGDSASPVSPCRMRSMRSSMNGIISPQCPMIIRSPGCRSKTPAVTIRSACSPASECQPQAAVASQARQRFCQPAEQDLVQLSGRRCRVQVERDVQLLEPGEQWLEPRIVEERAVRSQRAVDQGADEAEVADRALQLVRGRGGIAGGQGREPGERWPGWLATAAAS